MGNVAGRSIFVCCAALIALAGCSGGSSSNDTASNASSGTSTSGSANPTATPGKVDAKDYPDWAQAVAPPYPNPTYAGLENPITYVFKTPDDRDTVAAWYKANVKGGTWGVDTETGDLSHRDNGVLIDINKYSVQDGTGAKTAVQFTKS